MKNKLTRKLMLSAFTLLFAVISLGASTYAWFTMSDTAKINSFQGQVKAGQGIEIAITTAGDQNGPKEWFTGEISSDIIQQVITTSGFQKFDALTSNDGKTFKQLNSNHQLTDVTTKGQNYIEFDLHFRAAEAGSLNLSSLTFDTNTDAKAFQNDQSFLLSSDNKSVDTNNKLKFEVESAARASLSIVSKTNEESGFELFEDVQENSTEESDYILAGNDLGFDLENGAFAYYNKKSYTIGENNAHVGNLSSAGVTEPAGVNVGTTWTEAYPFTVNLPAYNYETPNYVTVRVRVWVEGWDGECMNFIFGQQLIVAMDFKFLPTTPTPSN